MSEDKEKMTAEEVSVGADTRQSPITTSNIIADYDGFCNTDEEEVRVNNFREKSSAGINGLKLGAGFEQDC